MTPDRHDASDETSERKPPQGSPRGASMSARGGQVEFGPLWRAWRLASPWYRALSVAAAQADLTESYLARVERGRHRPSPDVTYRLTRLYLPPHVSDDLVFQVADEVKRVLAREEAPIDEMVRHLWAQAREHLGIAELSRITVFLSSRLWGGGFPDLEEGTLTEAGYRWLLFRWVAVAFAANPQHTTDQVASPPTGTDVAVWGQFFVELPVPLPEGVISEQAWQRAWHRLGDIGRREALRMAEWLAEDFEAWPAPLWARLEPADRLVLRRLMERLALRHSVDFNEQG